MGNNFNLPITLLADLHHISKIPYSVIDLDLIVQELFEGGNIEDFIAGGLTCIDDKLNGPISSISFSETSRKRTLLIVDQPS